MRAETAFEAVIDVAKRFHVTVDCGDERVLLLLFHVADMLGDDKWAIDCRRRSGTSDHSPVKGGGEGEALIVRPSVCQTHCCLALCLFSRAVLEPEDRKYYLTASLELQKVNLVTVDLVWLFGSIDRY